MRSFAFIERSDSKRSVKIYITCLRHGEVTKTGIMIGRMPYQEHPRFLRPIIYAENKTDTTSPCSGMKNGGRLKMS